jgi:hypothetical protein
MPSMPTDQIAGLYFYGSAIVEEAEGLDTRIGKDRQGQARTGKDRQGQTECLPNKQECLKTQHHGSLYQAQIASQRRRHAAAT